MSMYEIEYIMEQSILIVEKEALTRNQKRDLFVSLYQAQNMYDCSWTVRRVENILREQGYLFSFPVEKHPEWPVLKPEMDLEKSNFWFKESYVDKEQRIFYCEAGSAIWQTLVDQKMIVGEDAVGVEEIPLLDMAYQLSVFIKAQANIVMSVEWYGLLCFWAISESWCSSDLAQIEKIRDNLLFDTAVYSSVPKAQLLGNHLDYVLSDESEAVQIVVAPYLAWLKTQ